MVLLSSDAAGCPVYVGEYVDEGPHCCDLACVMGDRPPQLWEGDQA